MSGQYGEPDWANPTASSAPASAPVESSGNGDGGWSSAAAGENFSSAVNTNPNTGGRNASGGKPNCVQSLLSIFSVGLSAMMCCLGVFGIMEVKELAEIFVSVYMILFSVLLFLYELLWWSGRLPCCDAAKVNKHLRTNFGFMYGVRGRGAYLVFVAFVVLGLQNDVSVGFLRYLTGGCFLGTGICMLLLHFWKPHILGTYNAPTAGLGDDDINMPV